MQQKADMSISQKMSQRKTRMDKIRFNIQTNPIIQKNTNMVNSTLQKKKSTPAQKIENPQYEQLSPQKEGIQGMTAFKQKYQLLQKIGEGSNGIVRKCRHKQQDKIYAVKTMMIDEQHIMYLHKNFKTIRRLRHENIISYKAIYIERKRNICNLVMEYIAEPNLLQVTITNQRQLKNIFYQLFEAVLYIHSKYLCHRDIKPQNILYSPITGKIKLIDFGISKKFIQRNIQKSLLTNTGTLYYKAPQMFAGGSYDERIDLWAIGVTIYKLIAGVTPFQSQYVCKTIENISKGYVIYDDKIWGNYSKFAKQLTMRLLKPKEDRISVYDCLKHFWFTSSNSIVLRNHQDIHRSVTNDVASPTKLKKKVTKQISEQQQDDIKGFELTKSLTGPVPIADQQHYKNKIPNNSSDFSNTDDFLQINSNFRWIDGLGQSDIIQSDNQG